MILMKNILFIFGAVVALIMISNYVTKENIIPDDAIRVRVIANSNKKEDQDLKLEIKQELETYLYNKLKNIRSVENADQVIKECIPEIRKIIAKYTNDYKVNYGLNHFPEKEYKSVTYEEGDYQSLVVTLGSGLGDNWWCVLFPPLCLLEAEESTDVEYHSFVVDTINKYMK